MTTHILQDEAEKCLSAIFADFSHHTRNVRFPLTDTGACRAFADSTTRAMESLWSPEAKLPPAALILAMIRLCQKLSDPSSATMAVSAAYLGIPRPFAHEMLERLQAELPPNADLALDHVGRIVDEAGSLTKDHDVRHAFQAYRARIKGALWAAELDALVVRIWCKRYPHYARLSQVSALREAA